MQSCV